MITAAYYTAPYNGRLVFVDDAEPDDIFSAECVLTDDAYTVPLVVEKPVLTREDKQERTWVRQADREATRKSTGFQTRTQQAEAKRQARRVAKEAAAAEQKRELENKRVRFEYFLSIRRHTYSAESLASLATLSVVAAYFSKSPIDMLIALEADGIEPVVRTEERYYLTKDVLWWQYLNNKLKGAP